VQLFLITSFYCIERNDTRPAGARCKDATRDIISQAIACDQLATRQVMSLASPGRINQPQKYFKHFFREYAFEVTVTEI